MSAEILIVDDEPDIRFLLKGVLEDEGYQASVSAGSKEALVLFHKRRPALIILDIWLEHSELDGLELLKIFAQEAPEVPVVMISGHGSIETAVASLRDGAYDFIEKPFQTEHLLSIVRRGLEASRLQRENAELRHRTGADEEIEGTSSAIVGVKAQIDRVAPTNSRVLITGPAGVGKNLAARMIHKRSARSDRPFVVLNCAMLAPERLEEELFGYERGRDEAPRRGAFERAHGGTLVLDEVIDMPLETQGKIVRMLQVQTFQRVNGVQNIKVDVRVLATSTGDLQQAVAAKRFREDLFYRLAVVPLEIPPLQERREDIPALIKIFLQKAAEVTGLPLRELSVDALTALQTYDWPGNVRELRNLMERLLILAPHEGEPDAPVRANMLPDFVNKGAPHLVGTATPDGDIMALSLREARDVFETQYLQVQLMRFGGNISRTASFVQMERSALHRKLKQLGVTHEGRGRSQSQAAKKLLKSSSEGALVKDAESKKEKEED
ncbi:sigma-54-dependent Fis family transcriptional regulator [Acetobacteraceae bacterium]|nr:sigma-54-dependent Fis family transcriptional regulator [Acetobacteraceae bacterium]